MALQDAVRLFSSEEWSWGQGTCGVCGRPTNFAFVARCSRSEQYSGARQHLGICSGCQGMNIKVEYGPSYPPPLPGADVVGLDDDVTAAWQEARASLGAHAPTAAEHMCRKILVHVAAGIEGAPKKMSFQEAVDFLVASGTISVGMKGWVNKIRDNGNEAAHELKPVPMERALLTLEFTQRLLQVVYETRHRLEELTRKATPGG